MNKLREFLVGRYACNDALNIAIAAFGCILTFVFSILRVRYFHFITWIPFLVVLIRFLSKNIPARQKENMKFLELSEPWRKFIMKKLSQWKDTDHKYYNCPGCSRTLRVPKNRGKIKISCPHCGKEFTRRT